VLQALIARTSRRLFRLAARLTGSAADAQDVLQESYLRAFRALEASGLVAEASLDAWLYAIVTHVSLNWIRQRRRARQREEKVSPTAPDAAGQLEARLALGQLAHWLEQLPADQRVALVLKELEGRSSKEVAALLGITEGAVEQRLVRARENLRSRMRHG
jgi:RNA polymerase sigma-70 factor (ECF subfamily)